MSEGGGRKVSERGQSMTLFALLTDINECAIDGDLCLDIPLAYCLNVNGSYTCGCNEGFEYIMENHNCEGTTISKIQ